MATTPYEVPPLSIPEKVLVEKINLTWNKDKALSELTTHLQVAVEVELATIPIYLGTYYTIKRTPGSSKPKLPDAFPKTELSRFADTTGALIMSVAIEEMLHMSLSSNVLYALGGDPQVYQNAPNEYPAVLPGHRQNMPCSPNDNTRNIPIPLAKFSFEQLSHFLAIEYPAPVNAIPESGDWDTIGQIYSYIRCIISSKWIEDSDFNVRNTANNQQIKSGEYSPNCIDTVYPEQAFDYVEPVPAAQTDSAAKVAGFASKEDSHVGASQLLKIDSCQTAMEAIATIDFQGEGFDHTAYDDPSKAELSHYYKFLALQSQLDGYTQEYIDAGKQGKNNVAPEPVAPTPPSKQFSDADLAAFVCPAPTNPVASQFTDGRDQLVNIADGLFQYMLVMTETTFKVPSEYQKIYFNRAMHQSMIWVMDKFLQAMREIKTADNQYSLCATFANINLGERKDAYGTLVTMINNFEAQYGDAPWFKGTDLDKYGYLNAVKELPDVSVFWQANPPTEIPDYLKTPSGVQDTGTHQGTPTPASSKVTSGEYEGTPRWPLHPPKDSDLPDGAVRHACMGLNSCKDQGRTLQNDCAGQGFCSTALGYNVSDPETPLVSDHLCHVLNDCRNQGGCGLYGTEVELSEPGHNNCQSQGSCATPINAERFITDGDIRGEGVWVQARQVFTQKVWPELRSNNPNLPPTPPAVPGSNQDANLFQYGPTIGWIENDNGGAGMTACGASGMSGAGSCA